MVPKPMFFLWYAQNSSRKVWLSLFTIHCPLVGECNRAVPDKAKDLLLRIWDLLPLSSRLPLEQEYESPHFLFPHPADLRNPHRRCKSYPRQHQKVLGEAHFPSELRACPPENLFNDILFQHVLQGWRSFPPRLDKVKCSFL